MQIIKSFIDRIEETLGVRRNNRLTDLEYRKHGKPITHFDNGEGGIFFHDEMNMGKANPSYPGITEAIDKPIYDTVVVTTATTSLDLFQVPVGQSSKTINETSMRQSGILPSPEQFTVKRIGNIILTAVLADFNLLINQIVYTFNVNAKIYTQAPLFYYPAGFGIFGQTTATATSVISSGFPGELGVRSLIYDIPLNPLDPFLGNLTMFGGGSIGQRAISALSTLTASTEVKNFLQGPYQRAI